MPRSTHWVQGRLVAVASLVSVLGCSLFRVDPPSDLAITRVAHEPAVFNKTYRGPLFQFDYPSHWQVEETKDDFFEVVKVHSSPDSVIAFYVAPRELDATSVLLELVKEHETFLDNSSITEFTHWGGIGGIGRVLQGKVRGESTDYERVVARWQVRADIGITSRVFVFHATNKTIAVHEIIPDKETHLVPAFRAIEYSFRLINE